MNSPLTPSSDFLPAWGLCAVAYLFLALHSSVERSSSHSHNLLLSDTASTLLSSSSFNSFLISKLPAPSSRCCCWLGLLFVLLLGGHHQFFSPDLWNPHYNSQFDCDTSNIYLAQNFQYIIPSSWMQVYRCTSFTWGLLWFGSPPLLLTCSRLRLVLLTTQ